MSVAVITGTSNLNPLEVDVAKVAVVELDPRTDTKMAAPEPKRTVKKYRSSLPKNLVTA